MKKKKLLNIKSSILFVYLFIIAVLLNAQSPGIIINGKYVSASDIAKYPFWLGSGSTLEKGHKVVYIPVLEFSVVSSAAGGKVLQFDSVILVDAIQTVPVNKAWKIESVALDTTANLISTGSSGGDNWGGQAVVSNTSLDGNGTSISPLGIAQQGAVNGQVLRWDGSNWSPFNEPLYAQSSGSANNYIVNF